MKNFFQVFQELKGNQDLEALFMTTEVSRITLSRDRTKMKIYLHSDHLLKKSDLHAMEELIQKQVFSGKKIQIEIHESFHLSSQYNAKILFERYEDSLLDELKEKNIVLHQMFTKGKLEWEDESTLALLLPEIALFQKEEDECIRVIEKIVHERCGIILHFSIGYSPELNKAGENDFDVYERSEYREEKEKFESIRGEKQAENADRHGYDKSKDGSKTAVNKERPEKSLGKTKEENKEDSKGEGKAKDGKQEIKDQKEYKEKKDFKEKNNDSSFKRSFGSRGPFKRSDKEEVITAEISRTKLCRFLRLENSPEPWRCKGLFCMWMNARPENPVWSSLPSPLRTTPIPSPLKSLWTKIIWMMPEPFCRLERL